MITNYWFTADEHYFHDNIRISCKRPFDSEIEMNEKLIYNHNYVVSKNDVVVHGGDFTMKNKDYANTILARLNGHHIFVKGNHDYWLGKNARHIWEKSINFRGKKYFIVVCHYAMRSWSRSCHGSYQLHGHSHGTLPPVGLQHDIGVDNNEYFPVSLSRIVDIMENRKRKLKNRYTDFVYSGVVELESKRILDNERRALKDRKDSVNE